jgi:hypothetical protein
LESVRTKQPAQKPDYWLGYGLQAHTEKPFENATALYTIPPAQEPVGMTITGKLGNTYLFTGDYSLRKGDKVYTAPPKRPWIGLTDEEITKLDMDTSGTVHDFVDAVESALRSKNNG